MTSTILPPFVKSLIASKLKSKRGKENTHHKDPLLDEETCNETSSPKVGLGVACFPICLYCRELKVNVKPKSPLSRAFWRRAFSMSENSHLGLLLFESLYGYIQEQRPALAI